MSDQSTAIFTVSFSLFSRLRTHIDPACITGSILQFRYGQLHRAVAAPAGGIYGIEPFQGFIKIYIDILFDAKRAHAPYIMALPVLISTGFDSTRVTAFGLAAGRAAARGAAGGVGGANPFFLSRSCT